MDQHNAWLDANQHYLTAALERVRAALKHHIAQRVGTVDPADAGAITGEDLVNLVAGMVNPPALATLCQLFGLSPFEQDLLLLCAGVELDAEFAALCSQAQANGAQPQPTFGLALAALSGAHWSALNPGAPLRHWRLLEIGTGASLVTSPLRIDERVLHYLTGIQHLDEHLVGFVQPVRHRGADDLVQSHQAIAERIVTTWSQPAREGLWPAIQLCGGDQTSKQAIAVAATAQLGLNLYSMSAHVLPSAPHDLDSLMRLWEREAALSNSALLLDGEDCDLTDRARENLVSRFLEQTGGLLFLSSRDRRQARQRTLITFEVTKPSPQEQRLLWDVALGTLGTALNGQVNRLVAQFDLNPTTIRAICGQALGQSAQAGGAAVIDLGTQLWETCRLQARPRLDDLAQAIRPVAGWEDLVLPMRQMQTLQEVAIHVRQRARVYEEWGFAAKSARGLGISALFAGASGTGKTMAAEVLANELHLDLYRIDLSQVVSKYIGETEKNLRRVFDAAEEGGAILLFDEADALFGKRSEVKDSHDRYANIEVSYLLQRMEAYRGLAILTTNMKSALDDAFLRRIRFVVQFPFPDVEQRAEIWRRTFPVQTPTAGLDAAKLAKLNVAGGNIRNIALHAAFLAAEANEAVSMGHLVQAARVEYAKLEKPLTESEIRGWV